jgi:PAS domain S-box-containing protein
MMSLNNDKYVLVVSLDITSRKQAEALLKKTEQELSLIFDTAPLLIWQKDREGRYLQVNRTYCDTVGISKDTIVGKTDYDLFPKEIADQYVSHDRKVLDSRMSEFGIEEHHQKSSGEHGWSRTDKLIYYDVDGKITGTIGFATDITKHKRAEDALRGSEEKYRRIVETANEGILAIDGERITTFVNPQMAKMLGYALEEMIGKHITFFMFPEDQPAYEARMEELAGSMSRNSATKTAILSGVLFQHRHEWTKKVHFLASLPCSPTSPSAGKPKCFCRISSSKILCLFK